MIKIITIGLLFLTSGGYATTNTFDDNQSLMPDITDTTAVEEISPDSEEDYVLARLKEKSLTEDYVLLSLEDAIWEGHPKIIKYFLSDEIPEALRPSKNNIFLLYKRILKNPEFWYKPNIEEIRELLYGCLSEELIKRLPFYHNIFRYTGL